jgi:hypothetical protein
VGVKPVVPKPQIKPTPTINPWDKPEPELPSERFELKPLNRVQEESLSFEGAHIQLNRANLDPENRSITSKVQAELYQKDGQWFLENKSEHQTSYIRVQGAVVLKSGDILLLGDQLFEFKT